MQVAIHIPSEGYSGSWTSPHGSYVDSDAERQDQLTKQIINDHDRECGRDESVMV